MDNSIVKKVKDQSIKWLSFNLSRTQAYYFYIGLIIGLLYALRFFLQNILIGIYSLTQGYLFLPYLLLSILPILCILFIGYSMRKIQPFLNESFPSEENSDVSWFGIPVSTKRAPALFFLSLSALFYLTHMLSTSYINIFMLGQVFLERHMIEIINSAYLFIFLTASLYTMIKMRKGTTKDSEVLTWFSFILSDNLQFLVYLASIVGIISFIIPGIFSLTSFLYSIGELFSIHSQISSFEIWMSIFFSGMLAVNISGLVISFYSFHRIREMQTIKNLN